jgi:hypothetical protein
MMVLAQGQQHGALLELVSMGGESIAARLEDEPSPQLNSAEINRLYPQRTTAVANRVWRLHASSHSEVSDGRRKWRASNSVVLMSDADRGQTPKTMGGALVSACSARESDFLS